MNQKSVNRSTNRLFSVILLLSLLVSGLGFSAISPTSGQGKLPKSGGGAATTDSIKAGLLAVGSFDIQYLLLKQTVALWADGRGDLILERNIRNIGTANGTSATWYFDWSPGEYSQIRAWDFHGPLQFSTSQSGTRISVTVDFRQPVLPNATYDFSLAITINNMAYGSGNDWEAYWYTNPVFPVQQFIQDVTFPSNSTIQNIYPTPTTHNLNYLEWKYTNNPANWTDTIDVYYALSDTINAPICLQTDQSWAAHPYGNPINDYHLSNTIGNYGCWMTSAAMMIEYWSQRSSSTFHTNPDILNTWLRNNKGYDKSNFVIHTAIAMYAANNHVSLSYQGYIGSRNDAILDDYLLSGNPVIIQVINQWGNHFVLATGKTSVAGQATYSINDPMKGATTLLDYNNSYYAIVLYSGTPADPRTLRISAHSPVELLITDPLGRKLGFDPTTNTTWDEIPNAFYTVESLASDDGSNTPALEDKYLEIIAPLDGAYTIDVIGTGHGSYEIDVFASDWFGEISKKVYTGLADVGSVDIQTSYFSSYSGVSVPIVPYVLRASANPSSAASVDFTAFFSEPVTGVNASDFILTTTGVTGATITGVSGSGDTYTVTVNTGSGNGTIRLDVVDDNTIIDAASNPLGGVNVGDGDFTSGEQYTISNSADVTIGGDLKGSYFLASGESTRKSFAGVNNGPVKIVNPRAVPIISAERVIYKVNGTNTSFSEMMALPNSQLSTTYWLPWYNNVDLDTQLRFGNVSGYTATVHVFIGGAEVTPVSGITLLSGASIRVSYAGVNNGPVKIVSDQNIVAAERVICKVNGTNTSFSEMMALPNSQLSTIYWLPWYNNVDLDTQLRFGNARGLSATLSVFIGRAGGGPATWSGGLDRKSTRLNSTR